MSELYKKLGELLSLERNRQNIPLAKVSTELRIPEPTLTAIEAGDPSSLPSEVYFKLFLKSYCEYLGIDFGRTVEAIREELGETLEPLESAARAVLPDGKEPRPAKATATPQQGGGESSGFLKKALLVGGLIAVAFVVFIGAYLLFFKSEKPAVAIVSEPPAPTPEEPSAGDTVGLEGFYDDTLPGDTVAVWVEPEPPTVDSLILTLTARASSWATVVADGDTMVWQELGIGRRYRVAAKDQLIVTLGLPENVDATLNEQPAWLTNPITGRAYGVRITHYNRERFLTPRDTSQHQDST